MSCKAYKNAVRDAAATSAPLGDGVQTHLKKCEDCRIVFAEYQMIFAAVDAGVHHVANTSIPTALLPQIQKKLLQIKHENIRRRQQRFGWKFALMSIAALLLLALIPFAERQHQLPANKPLMNAPVVSIAEAAGATPPAANVRVDLNPRHSTQIRRERITQAATNTRQPEILVSSEEQDNLLLLIHVVAKNREAARELAAPASTKDLNALQVAPLQIARLQLDPLETTVRQHVGSDESR